MTEPASLSDQRLLREIRSFKAAINHLQLADGIFVYSLAIRLLEKRLDLLRAEGERRGIWPPKQEATP